MQATQELEGRKGGRMQRRSERKRKDGDTGRETDGKRMQIWALDLTLSILSHQDKSPYLIMYLSAYNS